MRLILFLILMGVVPLGPPEEAYYRDPENVLSIWRDQSPDTLPLAVRVEIAQPATPSSVLWLRLEAR
jgi:hypothetical protein